ncbi:MAG: TrpR YerC/YecD, partial [Atopobiaceae bacterium]|nr:TrpR YerC/YecD [Atopobiaceae bacterium]
MAQENGCSIQRQRLLESFLTLRTTEEVDAYLLDILSLKELDDLTQRLEVARLLSQGKSYVDVIKATGASSTTVSRVSKCIQGEAGGYRIVLERMG